MKIAIALFGLLAAVALILAQGEPLADIPSAGLLKLSETTWGGGGRLSLAAACAFLSAGLAWFAPARSLAACLVGLALGMVIDLAYSGIAWRKESLALLEMMKAADPEAKILWKSGIQWLVAAGCFLLAQFLLLAYPARQPKAPAA